ncbi:MAG: hypothetical protein ACFFG0_00615 [Candidatus Thorarchaeota archaeon]
MENPCEECLVKVNCTQVCDSKKIYRINLKHQVDKLRLSVCSDRRQIPKRIDKYESLARKLGSDRLEITKIYSRQVKLKG